MVMTQGRFSRQIHTARYDNETQAIVGKTHDDKTWHFTYVNDRIVARQGHDILWFDAAEEMFDFLEDYNANN